MRPVSWSISYLLRWPFGISMTTSNSTISLLRRSDGASVSRERSRRERRRRSHSLEDRGDALAAADAHGDQRVPAARPPQLIQRLDDQDGARGTDRVPERDTAAVRVGPLRRQAELADDRQGLRRKRLVHLEHVDLVDLQSGPVKHLPDRRYRADPHDPRLDAGVAVGDEAAQRRQA